MIQLHMASNSRQQVNHITTWRLNFLFLIHFVVSSLEPSPVCYDQFHHNYHRIVGLRFRCIPQKTALEGFRATRQQHCPNLHISWYWNFIKSKCWEYQAVRMVECISALRQLHEEIRYFTSSANHMCFIGKTIMPIGTIPRGCQEYVTTRQPVARHPLSSTDSTPGGQVRT